MVDQAPVKVGELHDVEIKSVGEKGDGIARVQGFVLFVPGVKKKDYVKIRIVKVLEKVGFAEVVEKVERPRRESKFATVSAEEMQEPEAEIDSSYEDTDDFGSELDEE
jgi:predicted RNA-binding protein with TRAM domain